LVQSYKPNCNF